MNASPLAMYDYARRESGVAEPEGMAGLRLRSV